MIELRLFNDADAWSVFQLLDGNDFVEAELTRGRAATNVGLFADWRSVEGARLLSQVAVAVRGRKRIPFAVVGLSHTGQAGVAQAAMLAKSHRFFMRELAELGLAIRKGMPAFCRDHGIFRIEARCWADHPRAARFLEATGFHAEARLRGFGGGATRAEFIQYAFTHLPEE